MRLSKDVRDFVELLNSTSTEYLVVGGHAVGYHGFPRFTGDFDFFVPARPRCRPTALSPAGRFFLTPPKLPVCRAQPQQRRAGRRFRLFASGLPPDSPTRVFMGSRVVARGRTDANGRVRHRIGLANDIPPGRHGLSVTIDDADTAVTADCSLVVRPPYNAAPGSTSK